MNNNVFTVSKLILTDAKNKQTLYLQYRYLKVSLTDAKDNQTLYLQYRYLKVST